ncbi:MAG TPA: endolytic transglycosylase MltG [Ktedonobacterales bacterium]|nr:endolytic transglycosylase MltG [Ktedonobacterales bacterium]
MKKRRGRLVVIVLLLLLACGGAFGFGAWTVVFNLFQAAGPADSPPVTFIIHEGENTSQIANDLQAKGLIHNALAFELWARYQGLDTKLQAGSYQLNAGMTIPQIVDTLLTDSPDAIWATIPEGYRIIQMASAFAAKEELVDFKASEFIQIAQTGRYTNANGKTVLLASQYWFLNYDPQGTQGGAPNSIKCSAACDGALEGYLFPNTYLVDLNAHASDVIQEMLNLFGEQLCPGPTNQPDIYLANEQQCEAHGAILNQTTKQTIFDLLQKDYGNTDSKTMADKLRHALTLGSIVEREARTHADRQGIASVYYKRYRVSTGELTPPEDGLALFQADPTLQYWLGTNQTPWPVLQQGGNQYATNPYDTYQVEGLPPSPICSPGLDALTQAINPPNTPYFYFIAGNDGKTHYASNYQEQQQNIQQYGQ